MQGGGAEGSGSRPVAAATGRAGRYLGAPEAIAPSEADGADGADGADAVRQGSQAPARVLPWRALRKLTLRPEAHPRRQPHLSAASGLVCALGRVYVMADDEHHLAVFDDKRSPGVLHRLLPGDLPVPAGERKRRKPDLETLMWLPAEGPARDRAGMLLALGSGSTPQRERGFVVPLRGDGEPLAADTRAIDFAPLFGPLRARLGEVNIEGAFCSGGDWVLLHRGGDGRRGRNVVLRYALPEVQPLWRGERGGEIAPNTFEPCELGDIDGVGLGFTDGAAWPGPGSGPHADGGFLFAAVAEASVDNVADGACRGSVLGHVRADGGLAWMRRLRGAPKVEGLAVHGADGAAGAALQLCFVTDADDPAVPSMLLKARL